MIWKDNALVDSISSLTAIFFLSIKAPPKQIVGYDIEYGALKLIAYVYSRMNLTAKNQANMHLCLVFYRADCS